MDMRFDQFGGEPEIAGSAFGSPAALDWPGLSARLAAAHAIRQVMAGQSSRRAAASGSFAPALASQVAAYRTIADRQPDVSACPELDKHAVNQNAKVDGKLPGTITPDSKGKDPTAVRGLL